MGRAKNFQGPRYRSPSMNNRYSTFSGWVDPENIIFLQSVLYLQNTK